MNRTAFRNPAQPMNQVDREILDALDALIALCEKHKEDDAVGILSLLAMCLLSGNARGLLLATADFGIKTAMGHVASRNSQAPY